MKSFVFASDLHGDMQDPDAVSALYKFTEEFKPDVRIFGGDLFDFSPLMRGADPAEKNASMEADVEAGMEFPRNWQPHYFLLGNHDDRLWQTAEKHSVGIVRDTARSGIKDITSKCKKLKCKMLPYNVDKGVLELGIMTFVHGYFHGAVSATKQHALTFAKQVDVVYMAIFIQSKCLQSQGIKVGQRIQLDVLQRQKWDGIVQK